MLRDSGPFSGLSSDPAFAVIAAYLEQRSTGQRQVHYRLRDWGISRQRYWGAPIPIIYCDSCGAVPVPDEDLPIVLPEDVVFEGVASPLRNMSGFLRTRCPQCAGTAERETDTFDTFVESSWYYARYCCPDQDRAMLDRRVDYWLPVDQYIGGIEHAVLHLLYARFFHKVMRDIGLVPADEPFARLLTQGMVLKDGVKMSKSRGNTVDPESLVQEYGADTVRLFTMFAAPPDQSLEWSEAGVEGSYRFLRRLWQLVVEHAAGGSAPRLHAETLDADQRALRRKLHETIGKVSDDFERRFTFNTAIAAVMELVNAASRSDDRSDQGRALRHEILEAMVLMLSPIVPHLCHALWRELGHDGPVVDVGWPRPDPAALERDVMDLVVQVNGKLRAHITLPVDADQAAIEATALADENVRRFTGGRAIRRVIHVPRKLVNIVL